MSLQAPKQIAGYQLKLNDDFNNFDYDRYRGGNYCNWNEGIYYNPPNPLADVTASNSVLTSRWHRGSSNSVDISHQLSFRYGYFEAKMRFSPMDVGLWVAFWMLPVEGMTYPPDTGEIDVLEFIGPTTAGAQANTFFNTYHHWQRQADGTYKDIENNSGVNSVSPVNYDPRDWHRYGVLWTPGKLEWYFDDLLMKSATFPEICDAQHYFPVLTLTEGIDWNPGVLNPSVPDSLSMEVDYLRVWQAQ